MKFRQLNEEETLRNRNIYTVKQRDEKETDEITRRRLTSFDRRTVHWRERRHRRHEILYSSSFLFARLIPFVHYFDSTTFETSVEDSSLLIERWYFSQVRHFSIQISRCFLFFDDEDLLRIGVFFAAILITNLFDQRRYEEETIRQESDLSRISRVRFKRLVLSLIFIIVVVVVLVAALMMNIR